MPNCTRETARKKFASLRQVSAKTDFKTKPNFPPAVMPPSGSGISKQRRAKPRNKTKPNFHRAVPPGPSIQARVGQPGIRIQNQTQLPVRRKGSRLDPAFFRQSPHQSQNSNQTQFPARTVPPAPGIHPQWQARPTNSKPNPIFRPADMASPAAP